MHHRVGCDLSWSKDGGRLPSGVGSGLLNPYLVLPSKTVTVTIAMIPCKRLGKLILNILLYFIKMRIGIYIYVDGFIYGNQYSSPF